MRYGDPSSDPPTQATTSIVPDDIRAAIYAGHVGQVVIFCDFCETEEIGDYTGETREVRFAAARKHIAENKGWNIADGYDGCPEHPLCVRCRTVVAAGICCSSHNKPLCHHCYRITHFVEVCVPGCKECAAELLPVSLRDPEAAGGAGRSEQR